MIREDDSLIDKSSVEAADEFERALPNDTRIERVPISPRLDDDAP
jgi:hypothetical protein